MAKKVKQKKSGMERRRQQKTHKKTLQRRSSASRPSQQPQSYKELEKVLSSLPTLAFDTELDSLAFDPQQLQQLLDSQLAEPMIISQLVTPDYLEMLQQRLRSIETKSAPNAPQHLLTKATLYALEHNAEIPMFMNPLIIALYLKEKAKLEGTPLTVSSIKQAVSAYEIKYVEMLEDLQEDPEAFQNFEEAVIDEESMPVAEEKPSYLETACLEEYYASLSEFSAYERERYREDIEVFLEDYDQIPPEEWSRDFLDTFLGEWGIENLNPTEEDVISMQKSLHHFFQFLRQKQIISEAFENEAVVLLQDQKRYIQLLSSR
ncbi:hypothetical protein WDW89_25275 [Deltaproteobacteria bacterium TL4]